MPKLTVDGIHVTVPEGSTVIEALEKAGKEVPRFCYHPRLKIAGNCRMCLVEQRGIPKPIASCAMPAAEGAEILTQTPGVEKARKGALEFLLINHPLDCPICDQGGECDLQDITMNYGPNSSRYEQPKRAVRQKNMGPLISTFMTRCIHCTRCVRFMDDVAGVPELGALGRGEHMEITSVLEKSLSSELSGNIIDLCPVGALTSRPYQYQGRPWELTHTDSIDIHDALGSHIRIDSSGPVVKRILPREKEDINQEWLSDKGRFACDALRRQRLDRPYARTGKSLEPTTWDKAFSALQKIFKQSEPNEKAALAGDLADAESLFALKALWDQFGSPHMDCRGDLAQIESGNRSHYLFNTTLEGIKKADLCLLVGSHPRYEAPLLNARLRARAISSDFKIARIGGVPPQMQELTYPVMQLGDDPEILEDILSGDHPFSKKLKKAKNPMLILGPQAYCRKDGKVLFKQAAAIAQNYGMIKDDWNGFNVLHTAASRVAGLDIGFVPGKGGKDIEGLLKMIEKGELKLLYLLGADDLPWDKFQAVLEKFPAHKPFIIYQGHHGDKAVKWADMILPGAAYTEKSATYTNVEGRVQRTKAAVPPPGDAKEDWKIIRALSEVLGQALPYNTLDQLRHHMEEKIPFFKTCLNKVPERVNWKEIKPTGKALKAKIEPWQGDYYLADTISRQSEVMANCSRALGFSTTPPYTNKENKTLNTQETSHG